MQIGGRRLQSAAATITVAHLAGKREIVAEQVARLGKIMRGKRRTDARTGNARAISADGFKRLHAKTGNLGQTLQQGKIALPAIAEAEIIADQQKTQAQRQQIIADKIGRR